MKFHYIFGPVPSRRLGFSLGVDIVPFKTCTLNCVYCQLGGTPKKTIRRQRYGITKDILFELDHILHQGQKIDYITLSGSGEPTLNSNIKEIIEAIKGMSNIPVAVLTNGTLLYRRDVRRALYSADLVIPSLDAVSEGVFAKINRPHDSLRMNRIIEGVHSFVSEFRGKVWIEIMFVKGLNDHWDEVQKIKTVISEIHPQEIHINSVVRPPAEDFATALSMTELQRIQTIIGVKCKLIGELRGNKMKNNKKEVRSTIVNLTKRRAVTIADITDTLGVHVNEIIKCLRDLQKEKVIYRIIHNGQDYYTQMMKGEIS
ncbi:MAG: radical SAM protein [Thermodesulfobacteriota bacterium]|nr:radical SAM protein [Thermodesulfobacteriota bacterium]